MSNSREITSFPVSPRYPRPDRRFKQIPEPFVWHNGRWNRAGSAPSGHLESAIWNLESAIGVPPPEPLPLSLLDRIPNKREFLARSFGSLGILRLLEGIAAARSPALVVFTYHRIAVPGIDSDDYYDPVISATPEAFRAQVNSSASDLPSRISTTSSPRAGPLVRDAKKPAALITFDDGYRDNFTTALPILRELGVPAAFFIPSGYLQAPRLPWWDHVACAIKRTSSPRLVLERHPGDPAPLAIDLGTSPTDAQRTAAIMTVIRAFLDRAIPDPPWFLDQLGRQADVAIDAEARGRALFMGWDEVRQLAAAGMAVGSHGHAHVALGEPRRRRPAPRARRLEGRPSSGRSAARSRRSPTPSAGPAPSPRGRPSSPPRPAIAWPSPRSKASTAPAAPASSPCALRRLNVGTGDSPPCSAPRRAPRGRRTIPRIAALASSDVAIGLDLVAPRSRLGKGMDGS